MKNSQEQEVIFFDNASTSFPKPQNVANAIQDYLNHIGSSPGRGGYILERRAYSLIEEVREMLGALLSAKNSNHICFTHNATHSLNIVLKGYLKRDDHVIISNFEHNAIYRPLHRLSKENGIHYDIWNSNTDGQFDLSELKKLIKSETKLIALNHASNVLGVLSPILEVAKIAKEHKISLLVDVAQTAGVFPIAFAEHADFIAGTGHKSLLGPPGTGFLYVKDGTLLTTFYEGGSGHLSASPYHPESLPAKFEAGTCNYLGIAGLKGALEYLRLYDIERIRNKLLNYTEKALLMLQSIPEVTLYGPLSIVDKVPLISFNLEGYYSNEVAYMLEESSICTRSGLHCAPLMHKTLNTLPHGTVRLSFGHCNTNSELEVLYNSLMKIRKKKKLHV